MKIILREVHPGQVVYARREFQYWQTDTLRRIDVGTPGRVLGMDARIAYVHFDGQQIAVQFDRTPEHIEHFLCTIQA